MSAVSVSSRRPAVPLLALLNPRRHTGLLAGVLAASVLAGWFVDEWLGWPVWQAVALVLVSMTPALLVKWRADRSRWGTAPAVAGALVVVQALHSGEHIAQWTQRHVLGWPLRQSNGLLSPANSEWVHFVWNWLVVATIAFLIAKGMRGFWTWVLLAYALAHTLEHTYMWARFLVVSRELHQLGYPKVTAQGLPGILGRDGWLDRTRPRPLSVVCNLPFVTTATRLDTHATWNTGEVVLTLVAVNQWLRRRVGARPAQAPDPAS